jgi:hypothetical protein
MKMHFNTIGMWRVDMKEMKEGRNFEIYLLFLFQSICSLYKQKVQPFEQSCFIKDNDPNLMFLTNRN